MKLVLWWLLLLLMSSRGGTKALVCCGVHHLRDQGLSLEVLLCDWQLLWPCLYVERRLGVLGGRDLHSRRLVKQGGTLAGGRWLAGLLGAVYLIDRHWNSALVLRSLLLRD